jgi:hypothetical protein
LQEEYIKEEQKNLKRELLRAQEEVKRIQSVPLVIGQFLEMVNAHCGIVGSTTGAHGCTGVALSMCMLRRLGRNGHCAVWRHREQHRRAWLRGASYVCVCSMLCAQAWSEMVFNFKTTAATHSPSSAP